MNTLEETLRGMIGESEADLIDSWLQRGNEKLVTVLLALTNENEQLKRTLRFAQKRIQELEAK